ncbi:hypothetical protein R84B8_01916 [Treponema sp. R8-4-B8]
MATNKNSPVKLSILIAIFIVICLSGCSHWRGDMAKIVISLGGEGRVAYNPNDSATHQQLKHNIILTNTNTEEKLTFKKSGATFEAYVMPGNWTIWIDSWLDDDVYAAGSTTADLQLGQDNIITITMQQAHCVKFDSTGGSNVPYQVIFHDGKATAPTSPTRTGGVFGGWYADDELKTAFNFNSLISESIILYAKWNAIDVPGNTLAEKLDWLYGNAANGGNYTVTVNGNESISGSWLAYNDKKVSITLSGGTVSLNNPIDNNNFSMFTIGSNVTLILENITLNGRSDNKNTLVQVDGKGRLEMRVGSLITGNSSAETSCGVAVGGEGAYFLMTGGTISGNSSSQWGDAVGVGRGGTFEMRGGKITENTGFCRGVKVNEEGTFNMYKGEISYNHADHGGGGVRLDKTGIFNMYGGEIFDNTTNHDGGGVSTDGTFNMSGGKIYHNTAADTGGGVSVQGVFTMTGGEIYNNINTTVQNTWMGGGVNVNGTFNMSAGKIYGNTAYGGGGVNVYTGTFTMTGGEIYSNTVIQCGGGVNVQTEGRFKKSGGTIYGSDGGNSKNSVTGTWNNNNNGNGHAVSVVNEEFTAIKYHREKTAGPTVNLDSSKNGTAGGWE